MPGDWKRQHLALSPAHRLMRVLRPVVLCAGPARDRGLVQCPELADVVEKVRWWERQTSRRGTAGRCRGSGWHGVHGEWNKLGELAEVLGCSGEVELVTGAVRPA